MKRFLTLLMALTMLLALAACGGGDQEPAPTEEPVQTPGTRRW